MAAITNKDEVIRSNQARLTVLEERVQKLYEDYDAVMGMVQDLIEVVNGDSKLIVDMAARIEDHDVAVEDFENRTASLEADHFSGENQH